MKFTEQQLQTWSEPASQSEDSRMKNSRNAVLTALKQSSSVSDGDIKIIDKGSSHNNTNVKTKADVDLSVVYTGGVFFFGIPPGYTRDDFGIILSTESYHTHKNAVKDALYEHFDNSEIDDSKNKCTRIIENSYRVDTDVVPVWEYRKYNIDGTYNTGVAFYSDSGELVVNFPEQHTENGRIKNLNTNRKYKRIVRVLKRIRDEMKDNNIYNSDVVTSFLIESLVWNIPDPLFNGYNNLTDTLRDVLIEIYNNVKNDSCKNWNEVSNMLPLFSDERKWEVGDVKSFVEQAWLYAEFK